MIKKLTVTQKRWLLSAHILCSLLWLVTSSCLLVLDITLLSTTDLRTLHSIIMAMDVLDKTLIWTPSASALVTGALLSVLSHWGLTRFRWIIVKEILGVFSFVLGYFVLHRWFVNMFSFTSTQGIYAVQHTTYTMTLHMHLTANTLQVVSLTAMVIISVFKPWGQLRRPKKLRVA
jgi:hypothetical protein